VARVPEDRAAAPLRRDGAGLGGCELKVGGGGLGVMGVASWLCGLIDGLWGCSLGTDTRTRTHPHTQLFGSVRDEWLAEDPDDWIEANEFYAGAGGWLASVALSCLVFGVRCCDSTCDARVYIHSFIYPPPPPTTCTHIHLIHIRTLNHPPPPITDLSLGCGNLDAYVITTKQTRFVETLLTAKGAFSVQCQWGWMGRWMKGACVRASLFSVNTNSSPQSPTNKSHPTTNRTPTPPPQKKQTTNKPLDRRLAPPRANLRPWVRSQNRRAGPPGALGERAGESG
jgi:hypothetical protein